MSAAPNPTIVWVKEVFGSDSVLIADVAASNGKRLNERVVRSAAMAKAGVDSFWRVSGEHSEPRQKTTSKQEKATGAPPLIATKGMSFPSFDASKPLLSSGAFGTVGLDQRPDAVKSFREETRLVVGYRPSDVNAGAVMDTVIAGTISSPLRQAVDAIDVGGGFWIRSSEFVQRGGTYCAAANVQKYAVPVVSVAGAVTMVDVGADIVVFAEDPQFEDRGLRDLRSESEILQAADEWLVRISQSVKSTEEDRARIGELRGLLRKYIAETMGDQEFDDLFATLTILEGRTTLIEALPDILRRNSIWAARVQAVADEEIKRIREEFEKQFEREAAEKRKILSDLDVVVAERQGVLARIGEREKAYRDALADLETSIQTRVESIVSARLAKVKTEPQVSREEWLELKAELQRLTVSATNAATGSQLGTPPLVPPSASPEVFPVATASDRYEQFTSLSKSLSIGAAGVTLAVTAGGAGLLPVIVGAGANAAAIEIATAMWPDHVTTVFCDPTMVSLQDLLGSSTSGLQNANDIARSHPEALIPVVLCDITKAPCEFWLPALLEGHRGGIFQPNLRFLATAAPDGIRVPVPGSLLGSIVPIEVASRRRGGGTPVSAIGAPWPTPPAIPTEDSKSLRLDVLELLDVADPQLAALVSKMTSDVQALIGSSADEVASALRQYFEWLARLDEPSETTHSAIKYFQNFED